MLVSIRNLLRAAPCGGSGCGAGGRLLPGDFSLQRTWAECPLVAREKLRAKKLKGWLTAEPGKREFRPGAYRIRHRGVQEHRCFGVSRTQGPTQGIAGHEAEEIGGGEGRNM